MKNEPITHLFTHLRCVGVFSSDFSDTGDPGRIRTCNLPLRRKAAFVQKQGVIANCTRYHSTEEQSYACLSLFHQVHRTKEHTSYLIAAFVGPYTGPQS